MENDATYLGKIISVNSNQIEIEISEKIPSSSPIIDGKLYKIGQIGTFIKIPVGNISIFGIVSKVSNSINNDNEKYKNGSRFLTVNLIGEKIGNKEFEKGVGLYPTINDEVHLVTQNDLAQIYGETKEGTIFIGKHSSSDNLDISLDLKKLVLRHAAIVGSTGSGKSNAAASIIKNILNNYKNSRILLVDPHGEYPSAFPDTTIFRIGDTINPLVIPFWLMNFDELVFFLFGARPIEDQKPEYRQFRELITKCKKANFMLKSGEIDPNQITADSPIPFNIKEVWYEMNYLLNATYSNTSKDSQTKEDSLAYLTNPGDSDKLIGATFKPYLSTSNTQPPHKSSNQEYYTYEKKLLRRLKDERFNFLFSPQNYENQDSIKDLNTLIFDWIGHSERLTILDLSNVPYEVLDLTIGLITRFVYDSMVWGKNLENTGRNRPLLIAYEEAHAYLRKEDSTNYSKVSIEKIFKEGRKFGVGALVISQRPSEISDTILSQIGTFISLRLTNSSDQSYIKALSPDNLNSLIDLLPSLRIGEAIVIGEAIKIPTRVKIKLEEPRPQSDDPKIIENWKKEYVEDKLTYKNVIKRLREKSK